MRFGSTMKTHSVALCSRISLHVRLRRDIKMCNLTNWLHFLSNKKDIVMKSHSVALCSD